MSQYSFLNHPVYNFIQNLNNSIKGIENAYGIYCDYNKRIRLIDIDLNEPISSNKLKKISSIQKFRKQAIHLSWISTDLLPFIEKQNLSLSQLEIENEIENSFLILKFPSPIDHAQDVIAVQINGVHCFGLSKNSSPVNSSDKALIGNLFNIMVETSIKKDYNNYSTLQLINNSYESQLQKINSLEKKNKSISENASKTIHIFIESLKRKWENKLKLSIELEMDIVKDIISFNQNINNIETAFENAVYISLNTKVKNSDTVYLKRFHFHWDNNESSSIQEKVYSKHANILEFLDRYEKAAENALQKGWKINGNTVGRSCNPTVSAASITFNLKKYAKNVRELTNEYENRWPILMHYFKPFQNIINSANAHHDAISA